MTSTISPTVVIGSLDLLSRRMKDADPRHQGLVKNAIDGATRAASLTARLLAFSRQQPLEPKPIEPNALITDMSSLLQRTLGETVLIDCRFDPDLHRIFADPNQLENAILNLCVNAVDAMPKGGTLTVTTANVALERAESATHPDLVPGPYVTIAVTDTGTGMTPGRPRPGVRTLLHDEAGRQGHRTWPQPSLWLRAAVGWRRDDPLRGRRRHDDRDPASPVGEGASFPRSRRPFDQRRSDLDGPSRFGDDSHRRGRGHGAHVQLCRAP